MAYGIEPTNPVLRQYSLAEKMGLEPTQQITPLTDFPGRTDTNFG